MTDVWTLTIHTGDGNWPDDEAIGSHDFTVERNGDAVAFEPERCPSKITWGEIRAAIATMNKLHNVA